MKTVTKRFLKKHGACQSGYKWFSENCLSLPIDEQLLKLNAYNPGWVEWLINKLLNRKDKIRLAVFIAEFNGSNSKAAKSVIQAAKNVVKRDSEKNRAVARAAHFNYRGCDAARAAVYLAGYINYIFLGNNIFFSSEVFQYIITLIKGKLK